MRRLVYFILFATIFMANLLAADYTKLTIDGKEYYEYFVNPSEGVFAIARQFGTTPQDIVAANKLADTNLKVGQKILVPVVNPIKGFTHEVKPKETFYAISKKYNVSIDELIKANPKTAVGLKIGDILVIPNQPEQQKTPQKDSIPNNKTAAAPNAQTTATTAEAATKGTKAKKIKSGVAEAENQSATNDTPAIIDEDPFSGEVIAKPEPRLPEISVATFKVALIAPLMSHQSKKDNSTRRFIEFYRGVLLALEEGKKQGVSIELYVYDTKRSPEILDSILREPALKTVDLIIGPAFSSEIPAVATFARENEIYTVIPFSSKIDKADINPFLIQFNPPTEVITSRITNFIAKEFKDNNITIVRSATNDKISTMGAEIHLGLKSSKLNVKEVIVTDETNLQKLVSPTKKNLFIVAVSNKNTVEQLLGRLNDNPQSNISIWGFEEWEEVLNYYPHTYYYSLFNIQNIDSYNQRYTKHFGQRKIEGQPNYDLIGHDIMAYFIETLKRGGKNFISQVPTTKLELIQSTMTFEKPLGYRNYINTNWNLFTINNGIKTIVK